MPFFLVNSRFFGIFACSLTFYVLYYTHKEKGAFPMGIIYQTDKRSGITYAYENQSFWDPVLKRSKSKRRLIGRVDPDTKEIIPTDGRCRKRSPSFIPEADDYVMPKTIKELKAEVLRLLQENAELKEQIRKLTN